MLLQDNGELKIFLLFVKEENYILIMVLLHCFISKLERLFLLTSIKLLYCF